MKEHAGRARIQVRVDRLVHGNPGKHRVLTRSVRELKVGIGSGYRVYYVERSGVLIGLLADGDKSSQTKDLCQRFQYHRRVDHNGRHNQVTTLQNTFSLASCSVSAAYQQLDVFPERIAANAAANAYAPKNAGRPWRAHRPGWQARVGRYWFTREARSLAATAPDDPCRAFRPRAASSCGRRSRASRRRSFGH